MNTNNVTFPVKEVPAIWADRENGNILNKDTGHKFIVREDTGDVLSCMTNEYKLVKNETILDYANPIIKKNKGKLKEVKSFANGAKTMMKWIFPDDKVKISNDDELNPEIIIKNSYDGSIGVNILAGAFRLVCSNGAIIGVIAQDYKNKHSVYNVALDDIEEIIHETIKRTKVIFKDEFPILQNNKINDSHIVKLLKMFPYKANETVTQRLIADKPQTFWDLFNVGTSVLTHNMNRNSESTHKLESALYKQVKRMALKEDKAVA